MSYRYNNAFVKPGLNTLVSPTPIYTPNGLWGWGYNAFGGLGTGNTTYYSSPKQIGSLTTWNSIGTSLTNSFVATKTDGTIWSCGYNNRGQLGLGNTTYYSSPVQIGSLTNWSSAFKSFNNSSFAKKADGTLWSWGYNASFGQLGLGDKINRSSPTQVGALTNWLYVAAGYYHTLATKTDGTLWAWGANNNGQLGIGNVSSYSSPVQVGALTNWLDISCGGYHSVATRTDGTIWAWGANNYGQLASNNLTSYSSPKQIGSLTNWASVNCGTYHTLATKTDGTLWAWGYNAFGQLGIGNTTYYSSPKQVGALTNWNKISGGRRHSLATKTNFSLWSWGFGGSGQLGLGNTTAYSSPKQVSASPVWYALACNSNSSYAIQF